MAFFLSDERRIALIHDLMDMQMPHTMAAKVASFSDNLVILDKRLYSMVGYLREHLTCLKQATLFRNEEWRMNMQAYIQVDLMIIQAYVSQITEKAIPSRLHFPKTHRMIQTTIEEIGDLKAEVLKDMLDGGKLQ